MCLTGPRPTAPRACPARVRGQGRSYRLHQRARQLPERRKRAKARFVISGHDVVKAEAEDCIQHQWDQYLAGYGEPDAAVRLEPVQLLLDDLAVPCEELRHVGSQTLRSGRLDHEVEGGELDVAQAAQRIPQRLDSDLEHLQRVRELVEGGPELLHRTGGQVTPGLDQELGLGREPVLEVADGDARLGGDRADAGPGVAVFEEGLSRGVDDQVSGALGRGGPGHTYVLLYYPSFSGVNLPTPALPTSGEGESFDVLSFSGREEHRSNISDWSLWGHPH